MLPETLMITTVRPVTEHRRVMRSGAARIDMFVRDGGAGELSVCVSQKALSAGAPALRFGSRWNHGLGR